MQCLFMAVQGCRLTALKTAQTLLQLAEAAVQCLFMEVQGCRLTALKTRQTLLQLPEAAADLRYDWIEASLLVLIPYNP